MLRAARRRLLTAVGIGATASITGVTVPAQIGTIRGSVPQDFGARGDGRTDDTAALLRWRDAIEAGAVGDLPAGRYKVREGELVFRVRDGDTGAPVIRTAGCRRSVFVARGTSDAPVIEFRNEVPYRIAHGGSIDGIGIEDAAPGTVGEARVGLALSGLAFTRFGPIHGRGFGGDLVRIVRREIDGNPDPFHVALCRFEGIEADRCHGWAFNNDNGVGLNGCEIFGVRSILCGAGAIRSGGAGNRYAAISLAGSKGWAVERYRAGGTASRELYERLELDHPEYGLKLGALTSFEISHIRLIHRWLDEHQRYVPKIGVQLGGIELSRLENGNVGIIHRIDPGPKSADLGTFYDFSNDSNIIDVTVNAWLQGHLTRESGQSIRPDSVKVDRLSPHARITLRFDSVQYDQR